MWVWLGFVANGGHWVLWPEVVVGFSGQWWWVPIWNGFAVGVVLGFDVVVSFLCVAGFGYCWVDLVGFSMGSKIVLWLLL